MDNGRYLISCARDGEKLKKDYFIEEDPVEAINKYTFMCVAYDSVVLFDRVDNEIIAEYHSKFNRHCTTSSVDLYHHGEITRL